jgi:hypothetical protein
VTFKSSYAACQPVVENIVDERNSEGSKGGDSWREWFSDWVVKEGTPGEDDLVTPRCVANQPQLEDNLNTSDQWTCVVKIKKSKSRNVNERNLLEYKGAKSAR